MEAGKRHRKAKAGAKVNKQKRQAHAKQKTEQPSLADQRKNPKAYGVAKAGRARKTLQRNLDRAHRKEYVPHVHRDELDALPPPVSVVVMGPPGSGKSTVIRSLVKRYTRYNLVEVKGPVTVVSGKDRRLTFFECPNDLNAMIDLAKIADLVLLLVDASFGFEMETFEFLNLLQVSGFPKVMGILTHLDAFQKNKSLRKTKKRLKARFWTEIYQGAKLFYFSGISAHKYPKGEIQNLALYISRMKFRPLTWRNAHPYLLVDRFEDVTPPDEVQRNPMVDRRVTLYGYLRGTHLKPQMKVHIAGAGDFYMESVTAMPDPCNIPARAQRSDGVVKKKHLTQKDTLLYAPMSDVGNIMYDKDAMYINLSQLNYTNPDTDDVVANDASQDATRGASQSGLRIGVGGEGVEMVRTMQKVDTGIDERLQGASLSLFKGTAAIRADEVESEDDGDNDEEEEEEEESDSEDEGNGQLNVGNPKEALVRDSTGRVRRRAVFDEMEDGSGDASSASDEDDDSHDEQVSDEEEEEEEGVTQEQSQLRWKDDLVSRAAANFLEREKADVNLMELVYGEQPKRHVTDRELATNETARASNKALEDEHDDDGDNFFTLKRKLNASGEALSASEKYNAINAMDCSRFHLASADGKDWSMPDVLESIRNRFVTGSWQRVPKKKTSDSDIPDDGEADPLNDDEMDGSFEDLETGEVHPGADEVESHDTSNETSEEDAIEAETDEQMRERLGRAKSAKRAIEDDEDVGDDKRKTQGEEDEMTELMLEAKRLREEQSKRQAEEFGDEGESRRLELEGFRNGLYVRLEFAAVPAEFVRCYDPTHPILVGGLPTLEDTLGYVRLRFKKHRWHKKILKTNDPLVFSIGWRRFQSLPLYSIEDTNERHRYLKYTPEHMHCHATIYGPLCPPNTGVIAFQTLSNHAPGFRVSGTGVVLELEHKFHVVKKLKLIGTPRTIHKHTAFITGMFTSDLEVAKFEGASIRTVSGVRGRIKKALRGDTGDFRATFEDKILPSDLVFCRTWVPVEPKRLYNPVTSLLTQSGRRDATHALGLMQTTYALRRAQHVRGPVHVDSLYKPIHRPARTFAPFHVPTKLQAQLPFASKPKEDKKKNSAKKGYLASRAVVMEPEEKQKYTFLLRVNTVRRDREATRRARQTQRNAANLKRKEREAHAFEALHKAEKKAKYRAEGKEAAARAQKGAT
ncbi:hypothetical protein PsorP6_009457 [Peronosclerospora sorghi]|uniref:Uncharacterized protein n=1 Tax=Peronosclerospora sorghi TaxID=230839 RepID=A0ACC0W0L3_9STRA|nr:hypothetical protein PsorP6_009457 [Peronosclerospora sorghi]